MQDIFEYLSSELFLDPIFVFLIVIILVLLPFVALSNRRK